ncbi:MAG: hypothetical protein SOX26_01625 [Phocaeicola sp.]|nr:hypothetical protein [Phocaeicola sp.]
MDSFLVPWNDGNGNIVISNNGEEILISSDVVNDGIDRSQTLTFRTTVGNKTATLQVTQKGNRVILRDNAGFILRDVNQNILTSE